MQSVYDDDDDDRERREDWGTLLTSRHLSLPALYSSLHPLPLPLFLLRT